MTMQFQRPGFGTPKRVPEYYTAARAFIESLRATTTMREIAILLNRSGFTTPTGKPFCRQGVMNLVRKQSTN